MRGFLTTYRGKTQGRTSILWWCKITRLLAVFLVAGFVYLQLPTQAQALTITWDGGGGADTSWDTCANWDNTNTCPGSGDAVVFSATSTNNSTVTVGSNFLGTITSLSINSGYTGTITQASPLVISGAMTHQAAATYTAAGQTLSVGSTFTLNNASAIFTASSTTTSFSAAFTITAGTFNHNGGTVDFGGANNGVLSCNNIIFYLVTITNTAGTKTVNSNCSLPLGANPTMSRGITLNGTLSGTGTIRVTDTTATYILNSGATFTGFSGFVAGGPLTVSGATVDFSSYSSFSIGTNLTLSSGTLTLPNGADLNGTSATVALQITGGTFNAPSGTVTLAGGLTISGSPTFNANGGTITFDGSTATLACNNVTFSTVSFNNTGTKTVNSTCLLPLGANPTLSGAGNITLSGGTLSGSGILNKTEFTLIFNSSGTLSGFSGLSVFNLSVLGGTPDFSGYSSFVTGGTVTMTSGSISLPSGADINGNLTISNGTFTAPSGTMTLAGTLTISGSPIFNANGGTISFDGAGATITCVSPSLPTFNLVVFNHTSSTKTVGSNCSLPLGNNPFMNAGTSGSVTLNGILTGTGTINFPTVIPGSVFTLNSGATLSGFTGFSGRNLTIAGASVDFSPYTITNIFTFTLSSGSFTAPSIMQVGGDFSRAGGTFNHNNGTIIWQNTNGINSTRTMSGTSTFYNLYILSNGSLNIKNFPTGTNEIITGTFMAQDVNLSSSSPGTSWSIDAQGPRVLSNLSVQDSNNINSLAMSGTNLSDLGNNTNWIFDNGKVISFNLTSPDDAAYTNAERPAFKWNAGISNANSSLSSYNLSIDNGETGDWSLSNIPAVPPLDSAVLETNKYVVHYDNFTDSDSTNNYLSLITKSSGDWSTEEYDGKLKEGARTWTVTATDGVGNSVSQYRTLNLDLTAPSLQVTQFENIPIQNNAVTTSDATPTLFGTLTDPLSGNATVASGPHEVQVAIEKKNLLGVFTAYATEVVSLPDMYWTQNGERVTDNTQNTSDKFTAFSFTPIKALPSGSYTLSFTGIDTATTSKAPTTLWLTVGSGSGSTSTSVGNNLEALGGLDTQIIDQSTVPAESGFNPLTDGYTVQVKVVDTNNQPVSNASVTLHSTPRETTTNDQGIATFTHVEPGEHRVIIAYNGQVGEEKLSLTGDQVQEFKLTIQVRPTSPFASPVVIAALSILGFITLLAVIGFVLRGRR